MTDDQNNKSEEKIYEIIPSLLKGKGKKLWDLLWDHQKEALTRMMDYVDKYQNDFTDKSALVQMPTGSGKSGVITVLSTCISKIGLTLVLTPRKSLRNQLYEDIRGRFFAHISYPSKKLIKNIIMIEKGSDIILDDSIDLENLVLVMTIQMLVRLAQTKREIFNVLSTQTSLLLVDEGHYEPANTWSKFIRKIKAPKIILTATPYRNDFQVFDIDPNYIFCLSFQSARNDRYLRDVCIIDRSPEAKNTPEAFVKDILDFYKATFTDPGDDPPRVIIRCDDSSSIRHLALAFRRHRASCIGIHDTFKETTGWRRRRVPKVEDEDAVFWIHQFKLLEGIDDPRFQILAIYEPIRSARSLVQQIGRIIRNPNRVEGAKGYFLEHWDGFHKHLWNGFLKYDNTIEEHGSKAFDLSTGKRIFFKLIEDQPKIAYVEGRFCTKFDFSTIDIKKDIQLPLRVNLLKKLDNFDFNKFVKAIEKEYQKNRVVEKYIGFTNRLCVIISIRCKSSPFLRNHVFMEADVYITTIWEFNKYVGIYDSSGINWVGNEDIGIGHSLDVDKLKKLFRKGKSAKLKKISLSNSNLGTSVIQSRSITAASIEDIVPGFDDYAQVCTTAEGYSSDDDNSDDYTRRYVGFTRGRISQYNSGYIPLPKYVDWLTKLQQILEGRDSTLQVFSRYALKRATPNKADPRCILLDIEEIKKSYVTSDSREQPLQIDDTCVEVDNGKFQIDTNGQEISVEIKFESNKYRLISSELESLYRRKSGSDDFHKNIVKHFNHTQSFMVLPEDLGSVYVKGQFYNPKMKIGRDFDVDSYSLGNCFVTDNTIGKCTSEKGSAIYYRNDNTNWDPGSLFGIISRLGSNTNVSDKFGNPNIIICDDMGTEIADFLLCDTEKSNIIFIHAKASSGGERKCSASRLHDICAQAIKNLGYLAMFNDIKPQKLNSWDSQWVYTIGRERFEVLKRIHKADGTDNARDIWNKVRRVINNPNGNKEVWLFLGNIISRKFFEEELKKSNPKPHVIQAAYLLHATMSDIASVGAKFRIFCKE